jgi:flagella basal body P-ring formation protein FlgA
MKAFFKLVLLLLAIFPVWLTIIAFANPTIPSAQWKDAVNGKLIEQASESKKIQVIELSTTSDVFSDAYLAEAFEVKIADPKSKGFSSVEVTFYDEGGKLKRVLRVPARLLIEGRVVVATRDLNRGQRIQASDLALEWRDLASVTGNAANQDDLIGRLLRTPVKAGRVMISSMLETENLVKMGDRVRVIVSGNGLKISGFGIARQNGQKGETIRILNPDSKREIYGVVTSDQLVEVQL